MIFIKNKYTNLYFNIIQKARQTSYNSYTEKHHIVPKSLGGTDDPDNLVELSAREHFICHWLLTKMTERTAKAKMHKAVYMMTCSSNNQERHRVTGRTYQILKENVQGLPVSDSTRKKMSEAWTDQRRQEYKDRGRAHTTDTRRKISNTLKGKYVGEKNGFYGKSHTDESKKRMKEKATGRIVPKIYLCCTRCQRQFDKGNFTRHVNESACYNTIVK